MSPVPNERAAQAEIAAGRADIAAAALTSSLDWTRVADAANPYTLIPQLVVYQRGAVQPRDTLQLESAKLAVRAGSPQERILQRLKSTVAPTLQWEETAPSVADPVEDVESGGAQYAITDEREFSFAHHLYPNVLVGFALPEKRPVQWMVRRDMPGLLASVNAFFRRPRRLGPPAADGAGVLRRHPSVRLRGVARVPGARRGPPAAVSRLVRASAAKRHRLAAARRGRLPGVEVGGARGLE